MKVLTYLLPRSRPIFKLTILYGSRPIPNFNLSRPRLLTKTGRDFTALGPGFLRKVKHFDFLFQYYDMPTKLSYFYLYRYIFCFKTLNSKISIFCFSITTCRQNDYPGRWAKAATSSKPSPWPRARRCSGTSTPLLRRKLSRCFSSGSKMKLAPMLFW